MNFQYDNEHQNNPDTLSDEPKARLRIYPEGLATFIDAAERRNAERIAKNSPDHLERSIRTIGQKGLEL